MYALLPCAVCKQTGKYSPLPGPTGGPALTLTCKFKHGSLISVYCCWFAKKQWVLYIICGWQWPILGQVFRTNLRKQSSTFCTCCSPVFFSFCHRPCSRLLTSNANVRLYFEGGDGIASRCQQVCSISRTQSLVMMSRNQSTRQTDMFAFGLTILELWNMHMSCSRTKCK